DACTSELNFSEPVRVETLPRSARLISGSDEASLPRPDSDRTRLCTDPDLACIQLRRLRRERRAGTGFRPRAFERRPAKNPLSDAWNTRTRPPCDRIKPCNEPRNASSTLDPAALSDATKAEATRAEATTSDSTRAEATRSEATRAGATKPETA